MKHLFPGFLFLWGCCILHGQTTFQKQIPLAGCFYLESYTDGSLLTGGYADSCARLCRINVEGDILWALESCPTTLISTNIVPYVAVAPNQDAWVISRKQVTATTKHSYFNRFNSNGNLLWSRLFNTAGDELGGVFLESPFH